MHEGKPVLCVGLGNICAVRPFFVATGVMVAHDVPIIGRRIS